MNQVAARGSRGAVGLLGHFTEPQSRFLHSRALPCVVVDPYHDPVPVTALLALGDPPTAVVLASDRMALGGYHAAAALGYRIPDDATLVHRASTTAVMPAPGSASAPRRW